MPQTIFRVGERVVTRDGFFAKIVSLEGMPAQHSDTFDQILVLDVASVGLREGVCASLVTPSRDRRVCKSALQPQKHVSDAHARAIGQDNKLLKLQAEPHAIPHALMLWLSSLDDAVLRREFDAHADIPGRTAASADVAGERRMSRGGLAELLRDRGLAHGDTEVERVLVRVDANEDGLIDFGEFRALARANSDLEKVLRAKHLERVLCLFFPRGTTLEDLAAMSCAQLAAIVERSKEAQVQLLVDLAAQMKAVGKAQHAAGGSKFSGELKGGPLDDFYEGVTGVCGTPDAEIEKGMRKEHTERDDSHVEFSTPNQGITTTPAKEWALVLEGGRGCDEVEEKEGSISVTSTRGCCKASGLKWLNTGNADPTTLGLKWQAFGDTQPTVGRQLTNSMLADALASKRSEAEEEDQEQLTKVVDFTKKDWDIFSITDLRISDFIEAGGAYFKPIASTAQNLANLRLAEALMHKTEFTQQEWDAFGVNGLRMHHVVKSGDSFFQPAGTEAQADVRVLRPITHYGDFGEDGRVKWGVGDELVVGETFMITFVRTRSGLFVGDRGYDVEEKEELAKDTVGTVLEFNAEGAAKIAFREPVPTKSESKGGSFRSTTATTGAGFGAFGARTGGSVGTAKHVATGGGFGGGGFGASAGGGFGADTSGAFRPQPSMGAFGEGCFVGSPGSAFGAPTGAFGGGGAAAAAQNLAPLTAQQLAAFGVTSAPAFGQPAPAAPAFGGGAFGASTRECSRRVFGQPAPGGVSTTEGTFGQPAGGGFSAVTGAFGDSKYGAFPPLQGVGFGGEKEEEDEEEEEEEGKWEEEGWRRRTRWVPADQFYCLFPRPSARDTPVQRLVKLGRLRRCDVVALILYTGPMYVLYNGILRDVGFCGAAAAGIEFASDEFLAQWKDKDITAWVQHSGHKFTNTIHALASAIKKLQGLADKALVTRLYRGLGGLDVGAFLTSCGFTDKAFMSTTKDRYMALEYSGVKSGLVGTVLCIETSTTNNGAVLVSFSQYPGEEETVWNACSFMQHLPGKEEVELMPEGGVVRIYHVLVSANSRAETVEELEGRRKRVVVQVLDTLHVDVCRAIDAAAATAEFKARLAQDHGEKAFGGGTYEEDFILSIKDESAARVAVYKKLPDRAFAEIETLGETVSKGLALPLLANAKLRLWLEDLSLSLFTMGCRLSRNTTYLGLNTAQGRRLSRRRLRLQDNSTAERRGSIDQVGRIVVGDGLGRMSGAATAALALEDCRERRLITGAGAAALDRRDAFSGETPLITQVQLGEYENAKRLLQAGADANAATAESPWERALLRGGERALLIAAKQGRVDLVGLLAGFRAEVDARDALGRTALHWMSEAGNADMVQVLLKLGADVMAKDQSAVAPTSLEKASEHGHLAVVQTLLEHGADFAARDKYLYTSLHHASKAGHAAVVQTLLKHGADVAARASCGSTSLHYACEAGHAAVVETLLEHRADVEARDKYGETPRDKLRTWVLRQRANAPN